MIPSVDAMASRIKLKHFKLLIAIDDHGSLLRAAQSQAMSQPGATKMLREVEDAVGASLFERTPRGLQPNEFGRCVIRYSRLMLSDLTGMRDEIRRIGHGLAGQLSIGSVMGAVPTTMQFVRRLLKRQPNIKVQVRQHTSAELLDMLDKGRLDLAVCRTSVSTRPEAYRVFLKRDEQVSIIANRSHPMAGAKRLALGELVDFPWIVCLPEMPMRRHFEREFINAALPIPTRLVETASSLAIMCLLKEEPDFCSMQPDDVVRELMSTGRLCKLDVTLATESEPYLFVSRVDRELSPAAQFALKFLGDDSRTDDSPSADMAAAGDGGDGGLAGATSASFGVRIELKK